MTDLRVGSNERWYVLQTKPKQEKRAESNLRCWGIETLVPKLRQRRRSRSGETAYVVVPMFANYLFARFNLEALFGKIRLTRGVRKVVGFGETATPVEESVIQFIQRRIDDDGVVRPLEPHPGDLVEVIDGPLRTLVGVFERELSPRDRVVVLLTTVGWDARVQVAKALIRRIGQSGA